MGRISIALLCFYLLRDMIEKSRENGSEVSVAKDPNLSCLFVTDMQSTFRDVSGGLPLHPLYKKDKLDGYTTPLEAFA